MPASGYCLRHTRASEVAAVQALLDLTESAALSEPRRHPLDIATELRDSRMDRATNTWVAVAPGGELAGFARLFWGSSAQGDAEIAVHPDHRPRGVDAALLDAVEVRAAELAVAAPAGVVPRLHVLCDETDTARRSILAGRGYSPVRESYLMRIDLAWGPAHVTQVPPGVEVRTFVPGRDEAAVYAADQEAFADHFLFEPSNLEQWRTHSVELIDFDPSLWLIAWEEGEVAGEALTLLRGDEAYVDSLAVRRRWRGRGLGLALLTRAFACARQRGRRTVRLGVDAQNPTGALALYLKAGMRVERREVRVAKDLR